MSGAGSLGLQRRSKVVGTSHRELLFLSAVGFHRGWLQVHPRHVGNSDSGQRLRSRPWSSDAFRECADRSPERCFVGQRGQRGTRPCGYSEWPRPNARYGGLSQLYAGTNSGQCAGQWSIQWAARRKSCRSFAGAWAVVSPSKRYRNSAKGASSTAATLNGGILPRRDSKTRKLRGENLPTANRRCCSGCLCRAFQHVARLR